MENGKLKEPQEEADLSKIFEDKFTLSDRPTSQIDSLNPENGVKEEKDYPTLGSDLAKKKVKPFAPRSKQKKEQEFDPSPVVAVRNLPIDVTEKDLYELGMHFGMVVKIL